MRTQIVAGNWKMNGLADDARSLTQNILTQLEKKIPPRLEIILAPPFVHLQQVTGMVAPHAAITTAAQNCAAWEKGAYTGEISAAMIASVGARQVIIGHSERRTLFAETNPILLQKLMLALGSSLRPIFCCGETLAERNGQHHFDVVKKQLDETVFTLSVNDFSKVIIAYEPVWAIGTGLNATPAQAQQMHHYIRSLISKKFGDAMAESTPLLYGGSCNENNAPELFSQPDIDGGLIGGASLKADSFLKIIHSFPARSPH